MSFKGRIRAFIDGMFRGGACPHQFSFVLDMPLRRLHLTPETLADRLYLSQDTRVLEVGCGSGYFSVEVARRVSGGRLELFDLQPEMIEKTRRKLRAARVTNVAFTQGDARYLPYGKETFDVVFLVTVLGEVPDRELCFRECRRVLDTGGLLSITEQRPDPDFQSLGTVRLLAEGEGFEFAESFGRRWNYTANFTKGE